MDIVKLRSHQILLLLAGAASLGLWTFSLTRPLLLPILYFNTHLHELCHAAAALATGGSAQDIQIHADSSGVTQVRGGIGVIIGSAGYVGSALVGALLILASRSVKSSESAIWALFIAVSLSLALFVRIDPVGFVTGLIWLGILWGIQRGLAGEAKLFAVQFLGLSLSLSAVHSLMTLMRITSGSSQVSDAQILQQSTGVPAIVWASVWAGLGIVAVVGSLRLAWMATPSKA